jgi:hypothetical protein
VWDLLAVIGKLILSLFGIGVKPSKDERHEQTARDLGRQEVRADAAEQAVEAHKQALGLETRMVEAQAQVAAGQPPVETPHAGTDLFHS